MFKGSPRYGGLWSVYCTRKNSGECHSDHVNALEHGLTSRNLPPLMRGSYQPWYSDEVLSVRNVCVSLVAGYAITGTKVQNSKNNVLGIFQKAEIWRKRKKKKKNEGQRRGQERGRKRQRPRSTKQGVCERPSPSSLLPCRDTAGIS
jgi:hypothetical protein